MLSLVLNLFKVLRSNGGRFDGGGFALCRTSAISNRGIAERHFSTDAISCEVGICEGDGAKLRPFNFKTVQRRAGEIDDSSISRFIPFL